MSTKLKMLSKARMRAKVNDKAAKDMVAEAAGFIKEVEAMAKAKVAGTRAPTKTKTKAKTPAHEAYVAERAKLRAAKTKAYVAERAKAKVAPRNGEVLPSAKATTWAKAGPIERTKIKKDLQAANKAAKAAKRKVPELVKVSQLTQWREAVATRDTEMGFEDWIESEAVRTWKNAVANDKTLRGLADWCG